MTMHPTLRGLAVVAVVFTVAACDSTRDGRPGNPPSTATQRAYDRTTGAPATPADGTRGNPAGTNTSGAFPAQSDGRPGNPPGTAVERAYDRATGSGTSRR